MLLERLRPLRRRRQRKEKQPAEKIDSLLRFLGIIIQVRGMVDIIDAIVIYAAYRHTCQVDAPAIASILYASGLENPQPVVKGTFWNESEQHGQHNRVLRKFFPNYYVTPTDEERAANPSLSGVNILTEKLKEAYDNDLRTQVIYFPEGGRNTEDGKIKSGAFAISANLMSAHGIEAPIQPVLIENMPPILMKGPINVLSILQLLWWRAAHNPRGNHEVVITFLPVISPKDIMERAAFDTSELLAGAMMRDYIAALGQNYIPNTNSASSDLAPETPPAETRANQV